MKRISIFLLSLFILISLKSVGQSTITLPNGNFENWSQGNGYSVSVMFFSMPVYSNYTYPTGWKYPAYPVNTTYNYNDMDITINTQIPLLKVSVETDAPYGARAVRLQSFMLSDIVSQDAYNFAASSPDLDPRLTTSVFPTVLSTTEMKVEQLIPLLSSFIDNTDSMPPLLSIFANMDLDSIFNGGIALNGQIPGQMTGYYKYTSVAGGDNGGIIMVGSKYNPDSHRRELAGYGYTTALTDTANYAPFNITYTPLSEIDSTKPYLEADSLVVLLFSSANATPQRGSALYVDRLQLWTAGATIIEDTCSAVFNLTATRVDARVATFSWSYEGSPIHYEVEYGLQGFSHGEGRTTTSTRNIISLSNLTPDTDYDVYIRCACGATLRGEWSMLSIHTDTVPSGIEENTHTTNYLKIYPNPTTGIVTIELTPETCTLKPEIQVFDVYGRLLDIVETGRAPSLQTVEIDLSRYSPGIYIIKLVNSDKVMAIGKVVKE